MNYFFINLYPIDFVQVYIKNEFKNFDADYNEMDKND